MNTKAILMSVLMIGVVVTAAGAGTLAYFSDVETSVGNTFTAGTIDIAVDDENPWVSNYEVTLPGGDADDLKPCQIGYINFPVANVGTNTLDLWKRITTIEYNTGITVYPECDPVASSEPEYEAEGDGVNIKNEIGKWIYYDMTCVVNGVKTQEILESEELTVDGPSSIPGGANGYIVDKWIYLGRLQPGEEMQVSQSYHLYPSTPNEYQGDVMEFAMVLEAHQLNSIGAPTDELSGHGINDPING